MIEINLRPTLWFGLAEASGVDVVYATYRELIGLPALQSGPQKEGIKWIYTVRDLMSSVYEKMTGYCSLM